jgi:hypothetical protein
MGPQKKETPEIAEIRQAHLDIRERELFAVGPRE